MMIRRAQEGFWWIINGQPQGPAPLYWQGQIWRDGRPMFSFDPNKAAQFDTRESAEFQARMFCLPFAWTAEEHGWHA